jgi:putative transcriptional regulator
MTNFKKKAGTDPKPLTERDLARMVRITFVKRLRIELGLSQTEFSNRYHIPVATLRDWEQRRREPDAGSQAYLLVIAAEPDIVARALAKAKVA